MGDETSPIGGNEARLHIAVVSSLSLISLPTQPPLPLPGRVHRRGRLASPRRSPCSLGNYSPRWPLPPHATTPRLQAPSILITIILVPLFNHFRGKRADGAAAGDCGGGRLPEEGGEAGGPDEPSDSPEGVRGGPVPDVPPLFLPPRLVTYQEQQPPGPN
uniref:Uncharacterized protein n=1 Tax=Oryza punctata TaxID=4537 RepID=A0A0E0LYK1_ORYPU